MPSKILPIVGLIVIFSMVLLSAVLTYVGVRGVLYGEWQSVALFGVVMAYQTFFAKYNMTYIRFINFFRPRDYFKQWTFALEEGVPPPPERAMLTFHPHCVMSFGALGTINQHLHGVHILASRFALNTPLLGTLLRWWNVLPISPQHFQQYTRRGLNLALVPGGYEEATLTTRAEERVYIKKRKGFIKYALREGYTVYPVYTFNERKCYYYVDRWLKYRLMLNKIKMIGVFFASPYLLILPDPNVPLHTVVGKGIRMPRIDNPTHDDVNKYHAIYVRELEALFYRYRDVYKIDSDLHIY